MHNIRIKQLKKKLSLNGNSWVLYINKDFADFMGITDNSREVVLLLKDKKFFVEAFDKSNNTENCFIKKLIKRGSGYGLILTLPLLQLLDINPEVDFLNIDISEKGLIIYK